jgi:BON domain
VAIGAAGGYIAWEMFFDPTRRGEIQWTWDTWLLTLLFIGLIGLFIVSGFEEVEHRLRHGHWASSEYQRVRLGSVVLKGQTISVVMAVSVHLYVSLVLHRPEIALGWAVQFAIFAALIYAWLQGLRNPGATASRSGAQAGAKWGFWSFLLAAQLSVIIQVLKRDVPEPVFRFIYEQASLQGDNTAAHSALFALLAGVLILLGAFTAAVVASVSMRLFGYFGGLAVDKFESVNLRRRLVAGTLTFCVCNFVLGVFQVFFFQIYPSLGLSGMTYVSIFLQFLLVSGGSTLAIALSPPDPSGKLLGAAAPEPAQHTPQQLPTVPAQLPTIIDKGSAEVFRQDSAAALQVSSTNVPLERSAEPKPGPLTAWFKRNKGQALGGAAVLVAIALVALLWFQFHPLNGRTDQVITTDIQSKMFSDPQLKSANISINTKKGEVILSGEVPSDAARYEAFKLATGTPGVTKVIDKMVLTKSIDHTIFKRDKAGLRGNRQTQIAGAGGGRGPGASSRAGGAEDKRGAQTADAREQPPPPPQPKQVEIPAGTTVTIRMIDSIDSSMNHVGEVFRASLDAPLVVGNEVVVPTGTDMFVKLVQARSAGRLAGRSELGLELVRMQFQSNSYALVSNQYEQAGASRGKRTAETIGAGAAIGAAIGAIAGGGKGAAIGAGVGGATGTGIQLATKGKQVQIPSETKLDFRLEQPVEVSYFPEKNRSRR